MSLLYHPYGGLPARLTKQLFCKAILYLGRRQDFKWILANGMSTQAWHGLIKYLTNEAASAGYSVAIERPSRDKVRGIKDVMQWISESTSQCKPVLICFHNSLDHFTVVSQISASRLYLFDSANRKFVMRASCGVRGRSVHIPPRALLRLSLG